MGSTGPRCEVDHLQRLLDVQLRGLPSRPDAIPIEQPVGRVARLLDLGDQQTGPQGMHGSSGKKHAVPRPRLEVVQTKLACAASQFALERRAVEAPFQAGVDHAARFGRKHNPRFCFAEIG